MPDFFAQNAPNSMLAETTPQTSLGGSQRSPKSPSWIWERERKGEREETQRGRGREEKIGREGRKEGEGKKGEGKKGREGLDEEAIYAT